MRIMVTGDTGFLSSYLIPELKKRGHVIFGMSRRSTDIKLDILDLTPDTKLPEVDSVVHTAAIMSFNKARAFETHMVNLIGTFNLIEWMWQNNVKRLFHVSTAYLFDNNDYEVSKKQAEMLIARLCKTYRIKYTIIRPSIIIGDSQMKGEMPTNGVYTGLKVIRQAIEWYRDRIGTELKELRIKGDPRGSMNVIPVDIVANTIAEAIEHDRAGIIHATNPNPPTLEYLMRPLREATGVRLSFMESFEPNVLERMVSKMTKEFQVYVQGDYMFPSDIECPVLSREFITQASL